VPIDTITEQTARWYQDDMTAVGNLTPDAQPRATDFIPQMQAMIARLIASGHAYEAEGHVLFSVDSYADYGKLSGRSTDDMIAGARVEVAPYKTNPMDFVLWKPSTPDQQGWESPWGRGRPGWHIECSAMSEETLGPDFDIHGGGADLMFPHHENEIAQSCCATPGSSFAQVWLHNGMIKVDGKKMSKSLGNFTTVHDVRDSMSGGAIRLAFLMTHYRAELDWSEQRRAEAEAKLTKWRDALGRCWQVAKAGVSVAAPSAAVRDALCARWRRWISWPRAATSATPGRRLNSSGRSTSWASTLTKAARCRRSSRARRPRPRVAASPPKRALRGPRPSTPCWLRAPRPKPPAISPAPTRSAAA
jgi:cysteinyl-tRNA synthetase